MSDVLTKVTKIIADQAMLEPDEIKADSNPEDLGLDSLAMVELVFAIEEEFDISVPYNANEPSASDFDISSVSKIAAAVQTLVDDKG
ncbi:MAG: acyl carrier protein [Pseudomonadota bacterium]